MVRDFDVVFVSYVLSGGRIAYGNRAYVKLCVLLCCVLRPNNDTKVRGGRVGSAHTRARPSLSDTVRGSIPRLGE